MSGVQAASAFEPRSAARVTPIENPKPVESDKSQQQQEMAVRSGAAKEEKFEFSNLNEDDKKKLEDRMSKLNDSLASYGKLLKFKYNDEAKQTYVEVVDSKTQQVVASLPPEFLVELSVRMKEMIGVFLDKKL